MQSIDDIKLGHQKFLETLTEADKIKYQELAKGQSPNIFVISCADSRVEPNVILNSDPGQIFTVRNVANLIPPYSPDGKLHGTSAALEFAVTALKIGIILVLGHTGCGGIKACLARKPVTVPDNNSFILPWVEIAAEARYHVVRSHPDATEEEKASLLEKEAIRLSMRNLTGFPFIQEAVRNNQLQIAGAVFDVENAQLNWVEKPAV
ncbi:MAG: carbonic anhydrase [Alphaproteobacteria bacterium]|jgi:carbonic anhydrase